MSVLAAEHPPGIMEVKDGRQRVVAALGAQNAKGARCRPGHREVHVPDFYHRDGDIADPVAVG